MAFQQEQFIISPSLNALLNIYKSSTQLIFSIIIFVIYNYPPIENIVSKKSTLFMVRIGDSYVHRIAYPYLTIYKRVTKPTSLYLVRLICCRLVNSKRVIKLFEVIICLSNCCRVTKLVIFVIVPYLCCRIAKI